MLCAFLPGGSRVKHFCFTYKYAVILMEKSQFCKSVLLLDRGNLPHYNECNMKLKNKDTKKYLLSVAVSTFVSYVVTFISFYGRVYYDIIETTCVCICLLNVVTALLAWKFAKSNSKMSLLVLHWELDTLAMLPLMGFSIWAITDGTIACFFAIIQFILLGIFNLFTVGLSLAVYSFIQHKCKIRSKDINQFCL